MSDGRALDPLREAFVGMLFALAIAQIGINAAAVIAASAPAVPLQPGSKVTASAHLFVALLLIACSWVGWRQSVSPGITEKVFARAWDSLNGVDNQSKRLRHHCGAKRCQPIPWLAGHLIIDF
jgi:hypothetical protein